MIKEYTRPLEQGIDSDKNIFSVLEERVERTPDDNLVEYKNAQGEWVAFTAAEFKNKVVALAKGLIARGVEIRYPLSRIPAGSGPRLMWPSCPSAPLPFRSMKRIRRRR